MTLRGVLLFILLSPARSRRCLPFLPLVIIFLFCGIRCHGFMPKHLLMEMESQSPGVKIGLKRIAISIFLGGFTGLFAALFSAGMIRCFRQYMNKTPILKGPVVFSPRIDPKTLELALANENQLLGSSPNGASFLKTSLDNGLVIAVKRLQPFKIPGGSRSPYKREIQRELELVACLRHRNLMSLRAYVRELDGDGFSLVYDYMPTGSLEDAMNRVRKNQLVLSWETRLKIAVGIVKGLKFLHFDSGPTKVLHYNLKPTNVLLDAEFEPKLGDWGLAKLWPIMPKNSGYRAPESSQNCRYTEKSDIFSFGVILGELLTGMDPLHEFFGETESGHGSMGQWLRQLQHSGEAKLALDKSLLDEVRDDEEEEDEMLMAVRIAVACMSDLPADRPCSDELVPMLSQLRSF